MIWKKEINLMMVGKKLKFTKAWFKSTSHVKSFWDAKNWETNSKYPAYQKHRWGISLRKRKADGKVGELVEVHYLDRKFGQPRWIFKKFGAKPLMTFRNGFSFGKALENKGFKRLGGGAYSTVYGKPGSNRVIKVTSSQDNWIDYVQWAAKKGYAGKFAPQVYSYKQIQGKEGMFSVSVMERMDKVFREVDEAHDFRMLSGLMHYASKGNTLAKNTLDKVVPGVSQFVTDLYEEFGSEDRFDLHDGNFMVRTDGSFALTDPVCGRSKLTVTRLKAGDFTPAIRKFMKNIHKYFNSGWVAILFFLHSKGR